MPFGSCRARRSIDIHWRSHRPAPDARIQKRDVDAEKAVAIAPDLAEARAALGFVRMLVLNGNLLKALSELKRAKELSPANPTANDLLARIIVYLGRIDEAERQARAGGGARPSFDCNARQPGVAFFSMLENSMRQTRLHAKSAELQPTAAAQPSMASAHRCPTRRRRERPCAKRNWSLIDSFRRFELAVAHYVRGDRKAADAAFGRPDRQCPRGFRLSNRRGLRRCEARKIKLSSGCKSRFDDHDAGMLESFSGSVVARLARRCSIQELARQSRFTHNVMSAQAFTSSPS